MRDMKIKLDLKKTIEQNAQDYFERAKKFKKKIEGAKKALIRTEDKLSHLEDENEQMIEKQQNQKEKILRKKQWFEKFRWFITSEGFLAIGGRDATTNEIVIKKHTDKGDLVFHTDMAGSPFFVIKKNTQDKEIGEASIQETANSTFCFNSRVWKSALGSADVFYVTPEQVTKEANTGEYLTKGAFMIRGKTNYVSVRADLAIGVTKDKMIMCAPELAVKANCEKYYKVLHGKMKPSDVAKKLKKEFDVDDTDEIIRALPAGNIELKKA